MNRHLITKNSLAIQFQLEGNWNGLKKDLKKLPADLKSSIKYGQEKYALLLVKTVKNHIINQDLSWDPKIRPSKSGSTDVLIDTVTYLSSITTWQQGGNRYIGIKPGTKTGRTNKDLATVAAIHEWRSFHGWKYRAVWLPSFIELGGQYGIIDIVLNVIYKKIKRMPELGKYVRYE